MQVKELRSLLSHYSVVLEPDQNTPEWWAGAPSVLYDNGNNSGGKGTFYLAARMREGNSPRGKRGYENRILKSNDGIHFSVIKKIHRDETNLPGFERPALVKDPITNKYKLYGCGEMKNGWGIWKLDDVERIEDFNPKTLHPVLETSKVEQNFADEHTHHSTFHIEYKDPFIWFDSASKLWHMFVIGFDRIERPCHFTSTDASGESWEPIGKNPFMQNTGWHNFFTRPACLYPLDIGYLVVYEGSNLDWWDPTYNIATGLAYTSDLENYIDLTPTEPLLKSTTPSLQYFTWRYSHWIRVNNKLFVYFEAARPNKTNELRVAVIDLEETFASIITGNHN